MANDSNEMSVDNADTDNHNNKENETKKHQHQIQNRTHCPLLSPPNVVKSPKIKHPKR